MVRLQIVLQVVLWTLVPTLLYTSPPLDVVEAYVYGPFWHAASLKHPSLPSWALEASRLLTGAIGWPAYLVSQLFVAATLWAVYHLGRDLLGDTRAAAGTLLLSGVFYFAWSTVEFNHNVAAMPLWAGFFLGLWRAVETDRLGWWLATGALAAAMMYAKLSSGLGLVVACGWLIYDAKARQRLFGVKAWLGAALAGVLVMPLYFALRGSSFAPLTHAAARAELGASNALKFVAAQVLAMVGVFILLAIAERMVRLENPTQALGAVPPRLRRYLHIVTWVPLLLVVLPAAVTGSGLRSSWAAPMMCFVGLWTVAMLGQHFTAAHVRPIFMAVVGLLVITPLLFTGAHLWSRAYDKRPQRGQWPQVEIAAKFRTLWIKETGVPLTFVAGHFWPAGLAALDASRMPVVIVNGELEAAPGVALQDLKRHGVLIVNLPTQTQTPTQWPGLEPPSKTGEITFPLTGARRGQTVTFSYAIIRPQT